MSNNNVYLPVKAVGKQGLTIILYIHAYSIQYKTVQEVQVQEKKLFYYMTIMYRPHYTVVLFNSIILYVRHYHSNMQHFKHVQFYT